MKVTTLRQLVDTCRGRVIDEKSFIESIVRPLIFKLENPNFEPFINESYMLSPLSDRQAQEALSDALKACQDYELE